ncbi:hydrolase [Clostridium beijerinckii]|uniref:HAD-IB family hydrolase n=1 Tax=Clostridium beijerinckii TaxID=1520 RepID=A0AB74VGF1_CLOBE|nr:HAD-IB family hydrolase [Clostridium beijerinckii]NOW07163.1 HAD superfamily hydrolase (TIGR01490 family) [Clostridium beijerinckii]NRZ24758.1 HAD superfamily hydrolase (TIGR01490 family) [Clostridium beijerinckii]NYB99028.1 HAD superfamily hydrolase (TIGR01490 family) [Clostridium beijerinckii]NYC05063.1 HAD superfamily hydrolase (TIGR01490 family) [Clostridium beijerinckii]OOM19440.1 haloacid dehalogenase-like hydrolase [Clostridium beijerinckii]
MKIPFAIFDVDHTLINGDSMFLMLFFAISKKVRLIFYTPMIFLKILLCLFKIIDIKNVKESIYAPIKYLNEKQLEEFYDKVLLKKINEKVMSKLNFHKDQGCHILLVSASPEMYLHYFLKNSSIDTIIGTKLKMLDGKCTNKIHGKNCKGIEKVHRIKQYLNENNLEIDFDNSFAYSDSLSDKPMLSLVKNRYKVNKNGLEIEEFI